MDVIPMMIFVCIVLVTLAVGFFAFSVKEHTFEHSERLELLPLLDDDPKPVSDETTDDSAVDENTIVRSADHGGTAPKVENT